MRVIRILGAALAVLLISTGILRAEPARLALVIGNGAYTLGPLANPTRDAALVAGSLKAVGFQVTEVENADRRAFERAVVDFGRALKAAGKDSIGLFYYAGHGIQAEGENYLIPVDAKIKDALDLRIEAIPATTVMASLESAGNSLNIVVLDACRNNPFQATSRAVGGGLARLDAPRGTLIAYSTAPGSVAEDGQGANSPYSRALARAIRQPGKSVEQVFKQVRIDVMEKTAERQVPWESSSLTGEFYFVPPIDQAVAGDKETVFWQSIAASDNPADFVAYLNAYPEGQFAPLAKIRLSELQSVSAAPSPSRSDPGASTAPRPPQIPIKDCGNCPSLLVLPAGQFVMGAPDDEPGRFENEGPAHPVRVMEPFAIGIYEVTRKEFAAFVQATGYRPEEGCWTFEHGAQEFQQNRNWENPGFPQSPDDPVTCVNQADALAYMAWLSDRTGLTYGLPSEAQWEYAARAGTQTRYAYGDDRGARGACRYGNVADKTAKARYPRWTTFACSDGYLNTAPVGSFAANGFGLHDMMGNVSEWTADCGTEDYWDAPKTASPDKSGDCSKRMLRGQSWSGPPRTQRSAYRQVYDAGDRDQNVGFRIARSVK